MEKTKKVNVKSVEQITNSTQKSQKSNLTTQLQTQTQSQRCCCCMIPIHCYCCYRMGYYFDACFSYLSDHLCSCFD